MTHWPLRLFARFAGGTDLAEDLVMDLRTYSRPNLAQAGLKLIETLPPATSRLIRQKVPPGFTERLSGMNDLDWVPSEDFALLQRSVASALGPVGAFKFWRQAAVRSSVNNPMMNAMLSVLRKLGVVTPRSLINTIPPAMANQTRNGGKFTVKDAGHPNQRTLEWEQVPEAYLSEPLLMETMKASCASIFDVSGVEGTIELTAHHAERRAVFVFTWK